MTDQLSAYDWAYETEPELQEFPELQVASPEDVFSAAVQVQAQQIRVRDAARALVATETRPEAPSFDLATLGDVLRREEDPPFRIAQLAPADGSHLISAMRKTGKTTFALNIAKSLLDGSTFLGQFDVVPLEGDIAFLNFEVSAATVANWARLVGIDQNRLHLVNLRGRRNPLAHPEDKEELGRLLRARSIEALFVDPFTRAFTGDNQNDASAVGSFLNTLDTFARTDVGARDLFLTAHTGWNDERSRGSSELEGWADSIIRLLRGKDGDPTRYIRAEGRDVDLDEQQLLFDDERHLLTLSGLGSRTVAQAAQATADLRSTVLAYVKGHPGASGEQIRSGVEAGNTRIDAARKALVTEGLLLEERGTGRGGGFAYRICNSVTPPNPAQPRQAELPNPAARPSIGAAGLEKEEDPERTSPGRGSVCLVCNAPLWAPGSIASGICGRIDDAHARTRAAA